MNAKISHSGSNLTDKRRFIYPKSKRKIYQKIGRWDTFSRHASLFNVCILSFVRGNLEGHDYEWLVGLLLNEFKCESLGTTWGDPWPLREPGWLPGTSVSVLLNILVVDFYLLSTHYRKSSACSISLNSDSNPFTDEEIENKRDQVSCPGIHSLETGTCCSRFAHSLV